MCGGSNPEAIAQPRDEVTTMHATANIPVHATPRAVRAARTMTRIRQADQQVRTDRARRRNAARRGYRGPLTRDEATVIALASLNAAGYR
jgi:hypothetical protein